MALSNLNYDVSVQAIGQGSDWIDCRKIFQNPSDLLFFGALGSITLSELEEDSKP